MVTRMIFVRHGQLDHEKENELRLLKLINDTPGFRASFAETVHDTDGLSQHIFANLERCDGFLAVMHKRGEVAFRERKLTRASVWVQQELAIVSFVNYQRHTGRRIKVRVFAERGIDREGLADALILNPTQFDRDEELTGLVQDWLAGPDFAEDPVRTTREGLFESMTADLAEAHWRYLEVMMVLARGTASEVSYSHVQSMLAKMGLKNDEIEQATGHLSSQGFLVRGQHDKQRGLTPTSLVPGFIDLLADELRRRGSPWIPGRDPSPP